MPRVCAPLFGVGVIAPTTRSASLKGREVDLRAGGRVLRLPPILVLRNTGRWMLGSPEETRSKR